MYANFQKHAPPSLCGAERAKGSGYKSPAAMSFAGTTFHPIRKDKKKMYFFPRQTLSSEFRFAI